MSGQGFKEIKCGHEHKSFVMLKIVLLNVHWGEWPSGITSLRQVTEVKLGRVRSDSGWVTSEV